MGYALRLCVRLDVAVRCVQGGGGHPLLAWFSGQAVVDTPYARAPSVLGYASLMMQGHCTFLLPLIGAHRLIF